MGALEEKRGEFEFCWLKVMADRIIINAEANNIGGSLQTSGFYSEISYSLYPRASMMTLRQVTETEEDTIKAYWKEPYVEAFDLIVEDLKDRLDSPLIKVFDEIENLLMNSINLPALPISIELTGETYGSKSN